MICDISGYTKFMLNTSMSLRHAQIVISELLQSVIRQVDIPLRISKLEGDAVFLYAVRPPDEAEWRTTRAAISGELLSFFQAFVSKVAETMSSNMCKCGACANVDKLRLKVVIHYGEVLSYELEGFQELSGPPVILVHRMLKNSVAQNEYILATRIASAELGLSLPKMTGHREKMDDFGTVDMHLAVGPFNGSDGASPKVSGMRKIAFNFSFMAKAWKAMIVGSGGRKYRNLPE
jgi:hypothetical protein